MDEQVVYWIGFFVALAFVVFGADDVLWDVFALFRGTGKKRVKLSLINEKPPKMLAVVIAAWHEDAVLGEVVDNLVASAQYPRSLYRVFLGVYPNDAATVAVARALEARHGGTVVCVVGDDPGPTSKAANINHTVRAIREYEAERDVRFASVTIHDAEDVVHPNEFKMTNYLIDDYDALQFPVFPLQRMPRLRLFFKTLTSSTYADEFAEPHFRTMVMRDELGFVPSAGTGFAIGRRVLDAFRDEDLLPRNSLTEDYKLSLTLRMRGFRVHYVLEKVPRVDARGRTVWDYIATRSLFPSTFKAAVRQKARWVYGITMQSASMADVFGKSELTFAERTFLYKDLKASSRTSCCSSRLHRARVLPRADVRAAAAAARHVPLAQPFVVDVRVSAVHDGGTAGASRTRAGERVRLEDDGVLHPAAAAVPAQASMGQPHQHVRDVSRMAAEDRLRAAARTRGQGGRRAGR